MRKSRMHREDIVYRLDELLLGVELVRKECGS